MSNRDSPQTDGGLTATGREVVPSGIEGLDELLRGGFPKRRSVLVTGGPGTGKTTVGMDFLQRGLEDGEECLLISTEQTRDELVDSFREFPYDFDDDNLHIVTLHMEPGRPEQRLSEGRVVTTHGGEGEQGFVLRTLGRNQAIDEHRIGFTSSNIRQYLMGLGDFDRVVLDSLSGLSTMAESPDVFRRSLLDFIRLFSDDFRATSLFTAEESELAQSEAQILSYATHGYVHLWRKEVRGEFHRFLRIEKLRGVNHDPRKFKLKLTEAGTYVVPRRRTPTPDIVSDETFPIDISGLNDLLGGGFLHGSEATLRHEGSMALYPLIASYIATSVQEGIPTVAALPIQLPPGRLDGMWEGRGISVQEAMDDDLLYIIDFVRSEEEESHENVLYLEDSEYGLAETMSRVFDKIGKDEKKTFVADVEQSTHEYSFEDVKYARREAAARLHKNESTALYLADPATAGDDLTHFFENASRQSLKLWQDDDGIEYLELANSPTGEVGGNRVVEYVDEVPYIRLD